ncbi:AEC family transporter [Candidatus Saccharibacteria bacterium]|nr:AEC family transporter [Candidatus Saccharibacteria bacterium]
MDINLGLFYSRLGAIGLILILGFFLGKKKYISLETNRQLVNLLLTVFMPASLFTAFPSEFNQEALQLFFAGLVGGIIVMLILILVSKIIFMKGIYKGELRYESQFAFVFNNATFLGYPIVANTFGETGIIAYCGFIIAFNIALFSYGIWLFERKITPKLFLEVVKNPNIIAVLLGMLFYLTGLTLPAFATDAVAFVGNATTPLSIICVGFMLSRADFKKIIKKWRLLVTCLLQLILAPVITFFALKLMHFPDEVIAVCTLIQALPTATSLGLFATKYKGNEIESSELVAISTLMSIITLPLMVLLLLSH